MATLPLAIVQANIRGEELAGKVEYFNRGNIDLFKGEYNRLWKQAKKCERRISRYKELMSHKGIGTETPKNADQYSELRAKILKEEQILYKTLMKIKQRQAEKDRIDQREKTKLQNRQKISLGEAVRLEKGKILEKKVLDIKEGLHLGPLTNTYMSRTKRSTTKNPEYVVTTKEKIKNEFLSVLNKEDKPKRNRKAKKKGPSYPRRNPEVVEYVHRTYVEPLEVTP